MVEMCFRARRRRRRRAVVAGELVVRGADDRADPQLIDDGGAQYAAETAGDEEIRIEAVRVGDVDPARAERGREVLLGQVDIRDAQASACRGELRREASADLSKAGDDDVPSGDLAAAERGLEGGEKARIDAGGRGIRGLADTALVGGQAADVLRALGDDGHELCARADIFRGHVRAAEAFDGVAEVEHGVTLLRVAERGAHGQVDDGLAAASIEPRRGILERHGGGETKGVCDGLGPVGVLPHPCSAEGLAELRGMNGDAHREARSWPGADEYSLVGEGDGGDAIRGCCGFRNGGLRDGHVCSPMNRPCGQ